MKIGFIGLGRMGGAMVLNLMDHGHKIVGYNRSDDVTKKYVKKGMIGASSVGELCKKLGKNKVIFVMIKAGQPVDAVLAELKKHVIRGDIIIDSGNSFYKDSQRRALNMKKLGINYLDCGTSGGVSGARYGACMMIGGEKKIFTKVEKAFRDMCVKKGYGYMGSYGAGHFVKMVHNGIEYGMMGAINEGLKGIEKHKEEFNTDMDEVVKVYTHGSIIESRLMSWLYDSFKKEHYLDNISCEVPRGETEEEMKKLEKLAKMPVLHEARKMRERSRSGLVCGDFIAAMRNQFGGHKVNKKKK